MKYEEYSSSTSLHYWERDNLGILPGRRNCNDSNRFWVVLLTLAPNLSSITRETKNTVDSAGIE